MLTISCNIDGRKIRQLINWLLKSWVVNEVKRLNYVKSYSLKDWKILKSEEKILLIDFDEKNKSKLEQFLNKQCSDYKTINL